MEHLIQTVLGNELILRSVISFLDIPSLKQCRLVSMEWKTLATRFLMEKSHLCLAKLLVFPKTKLPEGSTIPEIDSPLIRNISLDFCHSEGHVGKTFAILLEENLHTFFERYQDSVESITYIQGNEVSPFTPLCAILLEYQLPKLRKLTVKVCNFSFSKLMDHDATKVAVIALAKSKKVFSMLKEVEILDRVYSRWVEHFAEPLIHHLVKTLVNKSKKLEKLTIPLNNVELDLTERLKSLHFGYKPHRRCFFPSRIEDDIAKAISLEELTIASEHESYHPSTVRDNNRGLINSFPELQLPQIMKRLTKLTLIFNADPQFGFSGRNLDKSTLPNLEVLGISNSTLIQINCRSLQQWSNPSVKTLIIRGIEPTLFQDISLVMGSIQNLEKIILICKTEGYSRDYFYNYLENLSFSKLLKVREAETLKGLKWLGKWLKVAIVMELMEVMTPGPRIFCVFTDSEIGASGLSSLTSALRKSQEGL